VLNNYIVYLFFYKNSLIQLFLMTSDVLFLFYPTNKIYYNKIRLTKTHFLLQKRLPIDTKQMPVLFFKTPLTPKIKKPGQTVICFTNW